LSRPVRGAAALTARLRRRVRRDPLLRELRSAAERTGACLWLVGGAVRDAALGLAGDDVDLVAGRGCAALVREVRTRLGTGGFRFRKRSVTTWRFHALGRAVDIVDAARRGLERDLARRDLTINAMAFDLVAGLLVDPLRGRADLDARRLRPPRADAFRDDPLRALRLCRFLAQLPGFRASARTHALAAAAARPLRRVAAERVRQELDRLLLGADPRRGLETLRRLGLRAAVLAELEPLDHCAAGPGRPDVWTHTLDALHVCARQRGAPTGEDALVLRWSLLLHDVSKPETLAVDEDGRPTFHGHEVLGERRAEALLRRLRAPAERRSRVRRLIRQHLRPSLLAEAGAPQRGVRRLAREAGADLHLLLAHASCDAQASGGPEIPGRWRRLRRTLRELSRARARIDEAPARMPVDGRDVMRVLGLEPGRAVGRGLEQVRLAQEEGSIRTRAEALAWLAAHPDAGRESAP